MRRRFILEIDGQKVFDNDVGEVELEVQREQQLRDWGGRVVRESYDEVLICRVSSVRSAPSYGSLLDGPYGSLLDGQDMRGRVRPKPKPKLPKGTRELILDNDD